MENFTVNESVLETKPKEETLDNNLFSQRSIVLEDSLLDPSSKSITVESLLDDHFASNDITKQIVVEKIDDLISEGQFGDFNVSHSLHEEPFQQANGNITIVPDVFCNSVGETQIVSDSEGGMEIVHSNYFPSSPSLNVTAQIPLASISEIDEDDYKAIGIEVKKESSGNQEDEFKEEAVPKYDIPASSSRIRKPRIPRTNRSRHQQIRVDKDDPRCRLHFVKFMKRDGKTIKIWECGICGKEFIHQYTLMRHLPTHTDERNYKCKHCGKAFRQMSTLAQHKATHSEFRPYVCDICQKTFSRVSTLISHKKIHSEGKPHVCHICGKGFHQKGNLKNHFFTHTNERPYKCDVCGRGFNQSSNLHCHKIKTHLHRGLIPPVGPNSGGRYKCPDCSEGFGRRAQLRLHQEYVHTGAKRPPTHAHKGAPPIFPKKRKMGNIRIIQLPQPDGEPEDKVSDEERSNKFLHNRTGILMDPIDTHAMRDTLARGVTPFALLKPLGRSPVVVKIQLCHGDKHMLVPASASELKQAGKFSVTSPLEGNRRVQIKVPVVATIHQSVDENGEVHMGVEPPSDEENDGDQEGEDSPTGETVSQVVNTAGDSNPSPEGPAVSRSNTIVQHFVINPAGLRSLKDSGDLTVVSGGAALPTLPVDLSLPGGIEYIIPSGQVNSQLIEVAPAPQDTPVDLLATAVNLSNESAMKEVAVDSSVQYLRPTENIGEYEVVYPDEGGIFPSSQAVIQHLKPLLDENEPMTVDQSHLAALMNALQTAGYELRSEDGGHAQHIILNAVDDAIIVDNQPVQMVLEDGQEELEPSVQVTVPSSHLTFGVREA